MSRLSEIQDGIFHLRPEIRNSSTDKTDQYIDDEQAEEIAALSRTKPYTPADEDYSFYLVDSFLLDTDLVLDYGKNSDCLFCPNGRYAYLSRNNYQLSSFTGEKNPPEIYWRKIHTQEPFHCKWVDAVATTVIDHRLYGDAHHTVRSTWPLYEDTDDKTCYTGQMEGAYIHVIHACWSVWIHHSAPYICGKNGLSYTPGPDSCSNGK